MMPTTSGIDLKPAPNPWRLWFRRKDGTWFQAEARYSGPEPAFDALEVEIRRRDVKAGCALPDGLSPNDRLAADQKRFDFGN